MGDLEHGNPEPDPTAPSTAAGRGWCSTWGSGHFSTFDGHVYDFEGTCNYVFAAICKDASSPTFSVQLRREPGGNISRIIVELGASVVTVQQGAISIKDVGLVGDQGRGRVATGPREWPGWRAAADRSPCRAVSLPYTGNGLQITPFGQSMRLVAKQLELELVVLWGPGAHLTVRTQWGLHLCRCWWAGLGAAPGGGALTDPSSRLSRHQSGARMGLGFAGGSVSPFGSEDHPQV